MTVCPAQSSNPASFCRPEQLNRLHAGKRVLSPGRHVMRLVLGFCRCLMRLAVAGVSLMEAHRQAEALSVAVLCCWRRRR